MFLLLWPCFFALTCFMTYTSLTYGPRSNIAHGHGNPTHNGVYLGTQTKLATCFNMEWSLWTVALILALWKTWWDFFYGGKKGDWNLKNISLNVISPIQLFMIPYPPLRVGRHLWKFLFPQNPKSSPSISNSRGCIGHPTDNPILQIVSHLTIFYLLSPLTFLLWLRAETVEETL